MAKKPKKVDPRRARDRIYKELLKRSTLMAPDPKPVHVTSFTVVLSKQSARARQRHAQLAMACFGADPLLV
jgi:hypothetical protein